MRFPAVDVAYVFRTNFGPVDENTPGHLLQQMLVERGLDKTALAEKLGVRYPTVLRWTKDDGFTHANRVKAARALGLPLSYFEKPDFSAIHEAKRQEALAEFFRSPLAAGISDDERASLASLIVPLDRRPSVQFYAALIYLLRNHLEPQRFDQAVIENEQLAASAAEKLARLNAEMPHEADPLVGPQNHTAVRRRRRTRK